MPHASSSSFWCDDCGHHNALRGIEAALVELAIEPHMLVVVSGVGCAGKTSGFISCYAVQAPHGRAIPVATGIALTNPKLTVLVVSGDADAYAIGATHLMHAAKRDVNLTCVVLNNDAMALTEGQPLPASSGGFDSLAIALAAGAGFVARGTTSDVPQVASLVTQAVAHQGFSVVDLRSPCVIYGQPAPDDWDSVNQSADAIEAFRSLVSGRGSGVVFQRPASQRIKPGIRVMAHRQPSDFDRLMDRLMPAPQADPVIPEFQESPDTCDSPLYFK